MALPVFGKGRSGTKMAAVFTILPPPPLCCCIHIKDDPNPLTVVNRFGTLVFSCVAEQI